MSQAVASFVTKLITHFPVKHESQLAEQEWMGSMVRNLRGYSASCLEAAAQKLIDTRTDRRFPLPAECKKVCDEFASREHQERQAQSLQVDRPPPVYSDSRIRLADDLIQTPMGREAAREGWIGSLHDFARENARLPTGSEIARVKAGARSFDEGAEIVARGEGGVANAALLTLAKSMLKRREKLRRQVLGDHA
jgi:hypothetical protein